MSEFERRLNKEFAKRGRLLAKVWVSQVRRNTRGPILNRRSGRLHRNIFVKRIGTPNPAITVGTRAVNPKDGFPYAAWHEYGRLRHPVHEPVVKRLARQYPNKLKGKGAGGTGRAYLLHSLDQAIPVAKFKSFFAQVRKEVAKEIRDSFRNP